MRSVGLDLSLVSSGLGEVVDGAASVGRVQVPRLRGHERLSEITGKVFAFCDGADLVVLEGPAYGSLGQRGHHERAGLWWLVAHGLHERGVRYAVAAPAARCLYATGKGNASKDHVLVSVVRRYRSVAVGGNDEADALVLAAMGWHLLTGVPLVPLPQANMAAVEKVGWDG